jgi:hypothetical protein
MTRLISTMSVVLVLFCATTTITRTWARPSDSKTYLSDRELAGIHGGTPARYCWPTPSPPVSDVECYQHSITERKGQCGRSTHYMYPEQCIDDFGNENCSEETQVSDAIYTDRYVCVWQQDGLSSSWTCVEGQHYATCCTTITTSFTCSYETTSDCGAPIRCP